jgi:HSP20 family protein
MALQRYTGGDLFPSIPGFFNDFFNSDLMDWGLSNFAGTNSTLPAVNVRETDNEFIVEVAAPGMERKDFKVDYQNGRLTISSEKKEESKDEKDGKVTRREFNYQSFQRVFNVPEDMVNVDDISAKYTDGILYITLPKKDEVKPKPAKTIKIS